MWAADLKDRHGGRIKARMAEADAGGDGVTVTGASGTLAMHCWVQLVASGYRVRLTECTSSREPTC